MLCLDKDLSFGEHYRKLELLSILHGPIYVREGSTMSNFLYSLAKHVFPIIQIRRRTLHYISFTWTNCLLTLTILN